MLMLQRDQESSGWKVKNCLICNLLRVGHTWVTELNWTELIGLNTDTTVLSIFIPKDIVSDEVEILNLDILFKNFI